MSSFHNKRKTIITLLLLILLIFGITLLVRHDSKHPRVATSQPIPWQMLLVDKGTTLTHLFNYLDLPRHDLDAIMKNSAAKKYLSALTVHSAIYFQITPAGKLLEIKYPINADETLFVLRKDKGFSAIVRKKPVTTRILYKGGTIKHSLSGAAQKAGLTSHMYKQLTEIFAGEVNYHNIKPGDHFGVLYREFYIGDTKYRPGNLLAAEITTHGKTYRAVRFTYPINHYGYYTPNGHGIEPLFLSAPVKYKFISSYFTYHRMDPVIHKIRPHLGIDYAANYGTPIHSIGNGVVVFAGRDEGYGNAIIIKYGRHYRALYGHMERFAHHMHAGEHVKRGQVIGYVGSTGWSTGPHVHFGFFVNGTAKNFLKYHFIGGQPVPKSYLPQYLTLSHKLLKQLDDQSN